MATDTTRRVTDLTSRYVEDNLDLWAQYASGLRRLTDATIAGTSTGRRGAERAPDLGERARDLVHLSVSHYSRLLTTYADFATRLVTTVISPAAEPPEPGADRAPAGAGRQEPLASIELTFAGAPGTTVSQSFVVANRKTVDVEVGFELTEFVSEDGTSRFRAPVHFQPERFLLPAGRETVVECRIAIEPPFVPGTRYMALVRMTGFPEMRTALIVAPEGAATGRATAPAGAARHGSRAAAARSSPRKRAARAKKKRR